MNKDQISNILKEFQMTLQMEIEPSVPASVIEKLNWISSATPTVAEAKVHADGLLIDAMRNSVISNKDGSLGANEKKALYNAECRAEILLVSKCEYLLKEAHYIIESLRSILSYSKEEIKSIPYGT